MWLCISGEFVSLFFRGTIIWLMFHFLTSDNRPEFWWNLDTYGGRSYLYLLQFYIFRIFFHWQTWPTSTITGVNKRKYFVYFITFNSIYKTGSIKTPPRFTFFLQKIHQWIDLEVYFLMIHGMVCIVDISWYLCQEVQSNIGTYML